MRVGETRPWGFTQREELPWCARGSAITTAAASPRRCVARRPGACVAGVNCECGVLDWHRGGAVHSMVGEGVEAWRCAAPAMIDASGVGARVILACAAHGAWDGGAREARRVRLRYSAKVAAYQRAEGAATGHRGSRVGRAPCCGYQRAVQSLFPAPVHLHHPPCSTKPPSPLRSIPRTCAHDSAEIRPAHLWAPLERDSGVLGG